MKLFIQFFCLLSIISVSACDTPPRFGAREAGALTGAGLGAGLGAIVGNQTGNPGAGVAIGSAFGAVAGGLIGNEIDNRSEALNERDKRLDEQDRQLEENRRLIEQLRNRGIDAYGSERGVVANLPDVLFEFDSAKLTPDARRIARDIADAVRQTSNRTISVEGHTDSVGTDQYNQRLSERRARSVADELVYQGVSRSALSVRGFGKVRPVASNATAAGRGRNRRVEVVIENK